MVERFIDGNLEKINDSNILESFIFFICFIMQRDTQFTCIDVLELHKIQIEKLMGGKKMKVKDCMCEHAVCVNPEATLDSVAKLMGDHHIGCVPVCENSGKVVGIVTDRDIMLRGVACDKDCCKTPVSEVMTTRVIQATPETDIAQITNLMAKNQIRRVPIVSNDKVIGMISLGNLAQSNACGCDRLGETFECICDGQGKPDQNNM